MGYMGQLPSLLAFSLEAYRGETQNWELYTPMTSIITTEISYMAGPDNSAMWGFS